MKKNYETMHGLGVEPEPTRPTTVEPRYNEPRYNEDPVITNNI